MFIETNILQGCDGSILLKESSNSLEIEAQSQKNFGIRKLDLMNNIKSSLEEVCPQLYLVLILYSWLQGTLFTW